MRFVFLLFCFISVNLFAQSGIAGGFVRRSIRKNQKENKLHEKEQKEEAADNVPLAEEEYAKEILNRLKNLDESEKKGRVTAEFYVIESIFF